MNQGRIDRLHAISINQTFECQQTITDHMISMYEIITGERNPIYVNREVAERAHIRWPVAPTTLVISLVSGVMAQVAEQIPEPGGVSYKYQLKSIGWIEPQDTILTKLSVIDIDEERYEVLMDAVCVKTSGEQVANGKTVLKVL